MDVPPESFAVAKGPQNPRISARDRHGSLICQSTHDVLRGSFSCGSRMKKLLLVTLAGTAAVAAISADAADLARPVYKAPPAAPIPIFSWTGCYIGGQL